VRILSRHFTASYLGLFALTLTTSLLLMTVTEMLVNFDEIVEHREAAGGALQYLLLRVPALYLRDLIPAASFIAAFLCLGLAARAREITAVKTGGIAPQRVAAPVLLAAAGLALTTLFVNETLLVGATREFNRFEYDGEPIVYSQGSFWYHRDGAFYNVREANTGDKTLHGVRVYRLDRRGRLIETLRADEVQVEPDGSWRVNGGVKRRFDPEAPGEPQPPERADGETLEATSQSDLALLDAGEDGLSLRQLLDAVARRRRDGTDTLRFEALLHQRAAEPAVVLVFAFLAAPLGLGVERSRSMAVAALQGIAIVAVFRAAWHVASLLAPNGFRLGIAAPWLVLSAFAGLGVWLFARSPR
jgi:lipopolysaccharide export system permease protein